MRGVRGAVVGRRRDMTQAEFEAACTRWGFEPTGFCGYYDLGIPGQRVEASVLNAGSSRRQQLSYLIKERKMMEDRLRKGGLL